MDDYPTEKISAIGEKLNISGWFWTSADDRDEVLANDPPSDQKSCRIIEIKDEKYGRAVDYGQEYCNLGNNSTRAVLRTLCERKQMTACEWSIKS